MSLLKRWKKGIEEVTPEQQVKVQLVSSVIIFVGVLVGLITALISGTWWLAIILGGSIGISVIQLLGLYQKFMLFRKINKELAVTDEQIP